MGSYMDRVDAWGKDVFFGIPEFDDETLAQCRESGDWMPVAFEWYKHTAILIFRIAQLGGDNDQGLVERPHRHSAVMKGLLARSSKLMLASLNLVAESRFGDILIAIQRMAIESMVKLRWLIKMDTPEKFNQFIAAGLQMSPDLAERINALAENSDDAGPLYTRLLDNINASYTISGVTIDEIRQAKALPNFYQMLEKLNLQDQYLLLQVVASSQIHGDWADLIANHLEYNYGRQRFSLKSTHNNPKSRVCFVGISFAFQTLREYINYAISRDGAQILIDLLNITEEEFNNRYRDPVLRADGILPSS